MLSVKPSSRPTILDILNKSFVRKRVRSYIDECLTGPSVTGPDGAPDLDDMNFDSLREQGEKLGLNGSGSDDSSSQLASLRRGPIAGAMNAKKMRKVMG
jgi:hypothetical protein